MSNLIVPDVAENILNALWLAQLSSDVQLGLYQNNLTPVAASVFTDFTAATFTGYASQTVPLGAPATIGGKSTVQASSLAQFIMGTPGTGNTIYGYYVWVPATTLLLWAEKFDNAVILANAGDEIDIKLVFTLFSQF